MVCLFLVQMLKCSFSTRECLNNISPLFEDTTNLCIVNFTSKLFAKGVSQKRNRNTESHQETLQQMALGQNNDLLSVTNVNACPSILSTKSIARSTLACII